MADPTTVDMRSNAFIIRSTGAVYHLLNESNAPKCSPLQPVVASTSTTSTHASSTTTPFDWDRTSNASAPNNTKSNVQSQSSTNRHRGGRKRMRPESGPSIPQHDLPALRKFPISSHFLSLNQSNQKPSRIETHFFVVLQNAIMCVRGRIVGGVSGPALKCNLTCACTRESDPLRVNSAPNNSARKAGSRGMPELTQVPKSDLQCKMRNASHRNDNDLNNDAKSIL